MYSFLLLKTLSYNFSVIDFDPIFGGELFWMVMHCAVPSFSPHFAKRKLVKLALRGAEYFIKDECTLTTSDVMRSGNIFVRTACFGTV